MNAAQVAVIDDDKSISLILREALEDEGYHVESFADLASFHRQAGGQTGGQTGGQAGGDYDAVITDVLLPDGNSLDDFDRIKGQYPRTPIIVMSAHKTLTTAMRATAEGAFDYLPKPFDLDAVLASVARAVQHKGATRDPESVRQVADILVGQSGAMQALYRDMARVAQTDLTVLIYGESGTGKELVAKALHEHGPRQNKPYISVNMAAIPRELIESELFGHEKGAFTGADRSFGGRFAEADGGTLFLDEIGDMPIEAQTRLLRVLQDGEFRSLGSNRIQKADVRIFAASNKRLEAQVEAGHFREDLFFRLNVIPINLPPLRDRLDDLDALVTHFLSLSPKKGLSAKRFSDAALKRMRGYHWPGNVRELENMVMRLCVLSAGDAISADDVDGAIRLSGGSVDVLTAQDQGLGAMISDHLDVYFRSLGSATGALDLHARLIREVERPLIKKVLDVTGGNQIQASQILGLNRNTLRQRIRDLDIEIVKSPSKRS